MKTLSSLSNTQTDHKYKLNMFNFNNTNCFIKIYQLNTSELTASISLYNSILKGCKNVKIIYIRLNLKPR